MSWIVLILLCLFNIMGWFLVGYSIYLLNIKKEHYFDAIVAVVWMIVAVGLIVVTIKISSFYRFDDSQTVHSLIHQSREKTTL